MVSVEAINVRDTPVELPASHAVFSDTAEVLHDSGCPSWPPQSAQAWRRVSARLALTMVSVLCSRYRDTRRTITFIDKASQPHTYRVGDGDNLLDIAQANDLDMEGACGGSCACSTCHVIVEDPDYYDRMPEPTDDENDMLDLAFGLTETSRLGCQVKMSKELDGLTVRLPSMTRNLQASDFESK